MPNLAPTTFNDWPWKAGLLTWNRLPSTGVNHYRHHTNDSFTILILQRIEQNDLTSLTDRDRPITTDLRHLNLTANNTTAKLTNQFIQTGLSIFDWQQLFTWLWWWLPLWLSKRQSPLPTTVVLRTTLTRTIKLHYYMYPRVQTTYCINLGWYEPLYT